ncbi:MAG: M28 family peptidase [Saprospiraceae bacterium]|nr:M28 family peptidase [Saprospiraceae bacterium]
MKKIFPALILLCSSLTALTAQNQAPVIENWQVAADWTAQTLVVNYEVSDAENDPLEITLQLSDNNGRNYAVSVPMTGDLGFPVAPGSRSITCDISSLANLAAAFKVRLVADDRQPFDIQALVDEVDSVRMRANLEFIQGIRHRSTGAAHLGDVRDSLRNLFVNNGLYYETQDVPLGNYTGKNLIGSHPGVTAAEQVVVNDAHYDSVNNAPGADDNGSGVTGVMEGAYLLSRYPCKKTLRFIGFDLEEDGLVGSIRYVLSGIPAGENIAGVFNYEMIGYWSDEPNSQELPPGFPLLFPVQTQILAANQYRGDFITNVGNTASQQLALLFSNSAQQYVPDLKVITLDVPGNGQIAPDLRRSDHAPFWEAGKQALMLTDGANFRNECYHTPADTLDEKLNFTFMSNVVKATVASMAEMAEIIHGDWAATSFAANVGVAQAPVCRINAYPAGGGNQEMVLEVSSCPFPTLRAELYDLKGSLLRAETLDIPGAGLYRMATPSLPAGIYLLKINTGTETQTLKVALR